MDSGNDIRHIPLKKLNARTKAEKDQRLNRLARQHIHIAKTVPREVIHRENNRCLITGILLNV